MKGEIGLVQCLSILKTIKIIIADQYNQFKIKNMYKIQIKLHEDDDWSDLQTCDDESEAITIAMSKKNEGLAEVRVIDKDNNQIFSM